MTLEQAKLELVRRYKYLYENAYFILAPFMHEETEEELQASNKKWNESRKERSIYLNLNIYDSVVPVFEDFLLSDKKMENSTLYKMNESNRNDKEYLEKVKKGIALIEKDNKNKPYLKTTIDMWDILRKTGDYIDEQSGDLKNKKKKQRVLDEYYRILRYKNNGKIYTSGRQLNIHDSSSISFLLSNTSPSRNKKDIGVTKNNFITTITNAQFYKDNYSIFSEDEKQEIYLKYHDELPWNLEIACNLEDEYIKLMIETRLYRPENTAPCGEKFTIKEEEIFVNPSDHLYRYYQLCPHCGYIVNIPNEILSAGIKQRIEERCQKDEKLFRKMYLYSELFSLDKTSTKEQRRILKKD